MNESFYVVFRTSSVRNQDEGLDVWGVESFFSWVGYEIIALLRLFLKYRARATKLLIRHKMDRQSIFPMSDRHLHKNRNS